jgi:hypothetical protein
MTIADRLSNPMSGYTGIWPPVSNYPIFSLSLPLLHILIHSDSGRGAGEGAAAGGEDKALRLKAPRNKRNGWVMRFSGWICGVSKCRGS